MQGKTVIEVPCIFMADIRKCFQKLCFWSLLYFKLSQGAKGFFPLTNGVFISVGLSVGQCK